MVADVGDIAINPFDLSQAVQQITERTSELMKNGCKPLIMGGDHTISYPIIKAMKVSYCLLLPKHTWPFKASHGPCFSEPVYRP